MGKYISKQLEIEAEVVTRENFQNVKALLGDRFNEVNCSYGCDPIKDEDYMEEVFIEIPTLEGTMRAEEGDYLVKGTHGEFYPVKPDIFLYKYLPVGGPEVLKDSLCYLIGGIDYAQDQGVGWRKILIQKCKERGLDIWWLDPTNKITGLQEEIGTEHDKLINYKKSGDFEAASKMMKRIVREDHRSCDLSDFVIFYIDPDVHTCGSYFEFQSALTQKKPYFIICEKGKEKIPTWLYGICDHNYFFTSIDEVVDELTRLNNGEKELTERWVLIRHNLKNLYDVLPSMTK